jgi:CBS domain-containing protein
MADLVDDVMNTEVFALDPESTCQNARARLLAHGLTAAPVVSDVADALPELRVGARMTTPVLALRRHASIEEAARMFAERGLHHAPVVDDDERVVGFVSVVDLLRGLFDLPARHPSSRLRRDPHTGALWTDDAPLDPAHAEAAPASPGVLVLVERHHGSERVIVVESCDDLRSRACAVLAGLRAVPPFARELRHGELLFRCAELPDADERLRVRDLAIQLVDVRAHLEHQA